MVEKRDRLLVNAGGLLMGAGALTAFVGGSYGLSAQRPGPIIISVLLLMGYGVVGFLLMNRGERNFHIALPATAVLVLGTLLVFQTEMHRFFEDDFFTFVLDPALTLLLVYAAGAMLTHVVETMSTRVEWPSRGSQSVNSLLHLAAFAPVWGSFVLLAQLGASASALDLILIVGGSALVSIACVVGGYAAARGSHPAVAVIGATLGFLTSASYLFQFMTQRAGGLEALGQFTALLGLILTGLPAAIGAVAWVQLAQGPIAPDEPSGSS